MAGGKSLLRRIIQRAVLTGALVTSMVLAGSQLAAVHAQGVSLSGPTNCDSNAVVYCGAGSVSQLVGKYRGGDGRNSAASIQHIFGYFGISAADINGMGSGSEHVIAGQVTKSGDVYGGGKLLATGALTGGRSYIAGSTRVSEGGTTFYTRPPSVSFLSNSLSAYVVMHNGRFAFAILASCGNPVTARPKVTPPPPPPAPTKPKPKPAPAPKPTPPSKPAKQVSTNVCSGNTTNTANGNTNSGTIQTGNCSTNVVNNTTTTTPPPAPAPVCEALGVSANAERTITINNFQATANGWTYVAADVNWGDGNTASGVANPVGLNHQYQADGAYTVNVLVHFQKDGQSTTVDGPACQQQVTFAAAAAPSVSPPPAPPTPTSAAVETAAPAAPTTLVNTGPGTVPEILGLFSVSSILSALGYRYFLVRRIRV